MTLPVGTKTKIAFAEESAYGTFVTGATAPQYLYFNSETLGQTINTINSEMLRPDRKMPAIRGGNITAAGDITTELQLRALGVPIMHFLATDDTGVEALGSMTGLKDLTTWSATPVIVGDVVEGASNHFYICTVAGTTAATEPSNPVEGVKYTSDTAELLCIENSAEGNWKAHWLSGSADMPTGGLSFEKFIERGGTDSFFPFSGGRVNTLNIDIPQEGIVGVTLGMLFQQGGEPTAASAFTNIGSAVTFDDEPLAGYDVVLEAVASAASPTYSSSTVIPYVQAASINMTNNFDETPFAIGSRYRRGLPEGRRVITGNMTVFFESEQEFDWFIQEQSLEFKWSFINRNGMLQLLMPEVKITGNGTPQVGGQGVVTASFDFSAFYQGNGSITDDIQVLLVNEDAAISAS